MTGGGAAYEFRWRRWALLRDCVVHHLEDDQPGSRFPLFFLIGSALGGRSLMLSPGPLASELRQIQEGMRGLGVEALMLGPETASVLYPSIRGVSAPRPLSEAERRDAGVADSSSSLADHFGVFFSSALEVCQRAEEALLQVEVIDL